MLTLHCDRVRKLIKEKGLVEDIDIYPAFMVSNDAMNQYTRTYHETIMELKYHDRFVYELAQLLDVSCDYLMGWIDKPSLFVPAYMDLESRRIELVRLLNKYCLENEIEKTNTNVLAYRTGLDRAIFELLFSGDKACSAWMVTSYFVISRIAHTFDANFYTVASFMLDAENDDGPGMTYLREFINMYNEEYGTEFIVNPAGE